jgi:hypothetical protein
MESLSKTFADRLEYTNYPYEQRLKPKASVFKDKGVELENRHLDLKNLGITSLYRYRFCPSHLKTRPRY